MASVGQAQSWLLPPLPAEAELLTGTGLGTNTQTGLPGPTSKMEKKGNSECSQVSKSQDELFIFKHLSRQRRNSCGQALVSMFNGTETDIVL